jgi:hypothetical protein
VASDIATLLAVLIAAVGGIFVLSQYAPLFNLRIEPRWNDAAQQILVVKFEVENKSRVRANFPLGYAQVLEYSQELDMSMSHWVPFSQEDIRQGEEPLRWREPARLTETTRQLFPGEVISIERLYHCPEDAVIVHIGLNVQLEISLFVQIISGRARFFSQTATCFAVRQTV